MSRNLRVGLIGTGAIARLHARAYANIGYRLRVCTDVNETAGRRFAADHQTEFVPTYEAVCAHPEVDFVDVCTLPDFRLQPLEICAAHRKAIQVQKPMATTAAIARRMVEVAAGAGITLGVVSQHRFDESSRFLDAAIRDGRLGTLLQCDAYVKWYRSPEYYSRPVKGSWATEGGGALINQAIHQVDLLRWFAGPVSELSGMWQLGALHRIESEDVVTALLRYRNGATGVIQASTAFWPGYSERIELHGTKGSAIVTGDRLTAWDVQDDTGEPPPLAGAVASGASDPMAISLEPFERQFLDFGDAILSGRPPLVSGVEGLHAIEVVDGIYRACRSGEKVALTTDAGVVAS
jgi:predicted dehydrogenase